MDKCKTCVCNRWKLHVHTQRKWCNNSKAELAKERNKLEMAEAVMAGDVALITGLKNDLAAEIKMRNVWRCAYEESRGRSRRRTGDY